MTDYYRLSLKKDAATWFAYEVDYAFERSTPYYLPNPPKNWDSIAVKDERNLRMFGFVRSYTEESYDFTLEAKKILKYAWDKYGNGATVQLYVERLNSAGLYELDFIADLALSTSLESKLEFKVKSLDAGIEAKLKTREDLTVQIPVDSTNGAEEIEILPLRVLGKFYYRTAWPIRQQGSNTASFGTTASTFKLYAFNVGKTIVPVSDTPANQPANIADPSANNFVSGQDFENIPGSGVYVNGNNYLMRANIDLKNIVFKCTIPLSVHNKSGTASTFRIGIRKMSGTGVAGSFIAQATSISIPAGAIRNFTLSIDTSNAPFSMSPGERLILEGGMNVVAAQDINIAWEKDYPIDITFEHYTDKFKVKGIPWRKVGEILARILTDFQGTFRSDLFTIPTNFVDGIDMDPSMLYMLSGDSIRGVNNPLLKISLKEYQQASMIMAGAGMGVEGNELRMEKIQYFLNPNKLIADLGEVKDCKSMPASDFLYNSISIGYREHEYDEVNGRDEPNTTHQYLLPNISDKRELDMVSPVRADGLGIFYTWVNYALSPNRDSTADNTLFALQCFRPTGQPLRALYPTDVSPTAVVTGYLEPDRLMNAGLTPKHLLLRNGSFINSLFFAQDNEFLLFRSASRNYSVTTRMSTINTITESSNVRLGDLSARMFYPIYRDIDVLTPDNYRNLWELNRNGYFTFRWEGKVYKGFPVRSMDKYAIPKIEKFKLLAMEPPTPTSQ